MIMSFASLGVVTLVWGTIGYSPAFAEGNAWMDLSAASEPAKRTPRPSRLRSRHRLESVPELEADGLGAVDLQARRSESRRRLHAVHVRADQEVSALDRHARSG